MWLQIVERLTLGQYGSPYDISSYRKDDDHVGSLGVASLLQETRLRALAAYRGHYVAYAFHACNHV